MEKCNKLIKALNDELQTQLELSWEANRDSNLYKVQIHEELVDMLKRILEK